jgi:steroid delta-isomerase
MTDRSMTPIDRARAYAAAFQALRPETLADLGRFFAEDAHFRDPFNDVTGRARILAVFAHMFETLDEPRFVILDLAVSETAAFLKWRMTFRPKGRRETWTIDGLSDVTFAPDGRVSSHIDHWDAAGQLYEKIAGLGWVMRKLRARLSARA